MKQLEGNLIQDIRLIYLAFPIWETLSPELSWSHYTDIIRVEDPEARKYYIEQASKEHWSVRQLRRNISTLYYNRLLLSADKQPIVKYSVLKNNEQLFASKYKLYLPSEEQLRAEIEREKEYYNTINHNDNEQQ